MTKKSEKRTRTSKKEEEWMEVPARKALQKKESKPGVRKLETSRHARTKAVLVKLAEEVSYGTILMSLKSKVNPEELGITV